MITIFDKNGFSSYYGKHSFYTTLIGKKKYQKHSSLSTINTSKCIPVSLPAYNLENIEDKPYFSIVLYKSNILYLNGRLLKCI